MSALPIDIEPPAPLLRAQKPKQVADLFCGAGGLSTGAKVAFESLGLTMKLRCLNHWRIAINTHEVNHPEAIHYCQDIATVRPIVAVPDGLLDLLMAAPSCTHFSPARGGKPTSDQQRIDPWHIVTWLTELRVKRLLVENVPAIQTWGPVNPKTGKPIKSRAGEYFKAWVAAIKGLGFKVEYRVLNCADHGDATTRERFFLMARSDGKRLKWPNPTHSKTGDGNLFGGALRWRPARDIIDWDIRGQSIFTRKKPLAPATIRRIFAGVTRHGWPAPYIVILRQHMDARGIDLPVPTIAAQANHLGLATPILLNRHGENGSVRAHSIDQPMPTADCRGAGYLVEPFVLSQASGGAPRGVSHPLPTIVTGGEQGSGTALISPYYGGGSGLTCSTTEEPLPTATAKARFGLVVPITHSDGSNRARSVDQPLPTLTTAHRGELAFISAAFGEREGQAPRIHPLDEPAPTICAQGRINLVEPDVEHWDILFRMLQPHELAAATGFIERGVRSYHFTGNKTEVTKQIGNAVPVNTSAALVTALMSE